MPHSCFYNRALEVFLLKDLEFLISQASIQYVKVFHNNTPTIYICFFITYFL